MVPDQLVSFGGTSEPCATIELVSIGRLGVEENKALSAVIYKLVQEKLGIPDTRLALCLLSLLPPHNWQSFLPILSHIPWFSYPIFRAYVIFTDKPRSEMGYKGTTFDELAKKKWTSLLCFVWLILCHYVILFCSHICTSTSRTCTLLLRIYFPLDYCEM